MSRDRPDVVRSEESACCLETVTDPDALGKIIQRGAGLAGSVLSPYGPVAIHEA